MIFAVQPQCYKNLLHLKKFSVHWLLVTSENG
jgi:hypothetical protein